VGGLPASALIGIRHALERGRAGQPVGPALLGTVMAVAALCATAVFGASLAHLVASPALYGEPFQVYFAPSGNPGDVAMVTGPLLDSLRRDRAVEQITLAAAAEIEINGHQVQVFAVQPVHGPVLLSAIDGRRPSGNREIMLGTATMRETGARLGGSVRVRVTDPDGVPHEAAFRVTGRASLNGGTGGMGNGAALTMNSLISTQCPAELGQPSCQRTARHNAAYIVLVRAAPGDAGSAALARFIQRYHRLAYQPAKPTALVNFGESVDFPLLLGVMLSLFGAATMVHLLLVSVARRRTETALLKALGLVRRQVAGVFYWQATAVALVGVAAGVPVGLAAGRALWRVFATNFGVVPVAVVRPLLLAALVAGVVAAANVLAAIPALLAARSHPGQPLRTE
jgi:FtsX-like permease family